MAYDPTKYVEYFEIDEGYYPEINESSIKDPKNKWQSTFPHGDIVKLLRSLDRILDRASNADKKSLWLEGSYGTGKSRIIWTLQNLLTCPENEFDGYFDEYDNLRKEIDLRERLRSARNQKIVTAARYATGDITSTQKLIFAVFESLTAALKKGGYKFDGAKTLRGKIVDWLEADSANLEMFRAKIRKPEYRMSATLASRSAEEIIERLKNPNATVDQLVEDILKLGEREGIRAFNIEMEDLRAWIEEVIEENNLKALILFWDEFSKFFANNRNNLDKFQDLAELSNAAPFYLVIATHQSDSLAAEGDQSFRATSDRFIHMEITMPDNIALELIGHALKVKDAAKNEWQQISSALRERTRNPRRAVMEFANIKDEKILTDILPIHPMTAILLKNLASYFASNQRSIFNFIKNSDPNIKAFQDFISTKSPEDGDLLTIDCLWNFFYESGTDEHGGNVGRMNLKPSIRALLDSYGQNKENLTLDEQAVLKTVLLFQAIEQESRGDIDIFRPTEKNLELAFTGVNYLENGRAVSIANDLVRKNILFKKSGKVETFAMMAMSGDFAEVERLKKSIRESVKTLSLVEGGKLLEVIPLKAAQKVRYILQALTVDNFTAMINRITNEKEDYHIRAMVCFARNEDEQNKIYRLINEAIRNERYHKLVFIDASSNVINREVFNRWVNHSAEETYWRGKDNALADKMKMNAEDCLTEWRNSFEIGSFVYYAATKNENDERKGVSCQNAYQIPEELKDNVRRLYQYSFDSDKITDTLFNAKDWNKMSMAGIKQEEYSMLNKKSIEVIFGDVWRISAKYWEVYPDLSISRLKVELDALIKNEIDKNARISFDSIINYVIERGFMPLNIYCALTGFMLKEYAVDPYRFSGGIDGNLGGPMTIAKLAECIGDSMKQVFNPGKKYNPKYLELMSANQREFMKFASGIFGVTEDISVEKCAQKLCLKLKELGYPFWCYVDAADDDVYKKLLGLIEDIANSQKSTTSIATLAESAGQILLNNPIAFYDMKKYLTHQKGYEIFSEFLTHFEDGIIFELAREIGIDDPVGECQRRLTEYERTWLHGKETAVDDLKKLIVDYRIVLESKKFGIRGKSFKSCMNKWQEQCQFNLKIPADTLIDYYRPLKEFFEILKELSDRGDISQNNRQSFLDQLIDKDKLIREALTGSIKVFRDKCSYQLDGLNEEEIKKIYGKLKDDPFKSTWANYIKNVTQLVQNEQSAQLKNKLSNLWREVAGNRSPREWSKAHRTPILVMVPTSETEIAKKVFETIMSPSPNENAVQFALNYLEKRPSYFETLNDDEQIEKNFRDKIIGEELSALLNNNNEVRDVLEKKIADAYEWYSLLEVRSLIKKFAEHKYYSGDAHDRVAARVARMPEEKAKEFLMALLEKNFEVGLAILREF